MAKKKFWKSKKLNELNHNEWEALCDNCGKCCVIKLINEKNNDLFYTNVSCHLLDTNSCKCKDYEHRKKLVPDCVKLTPKNLSQLDWMPKTCAYRLIHEGKELPDWHPLIQKTNKGRIIKKYSVAKRVISEKDINMEKITDYIFDWEQGEKS